MSLDKRTLRDLAAYITECALGSSLLATDASVRTGEVDETASGLKTGVVAASERVDGRWIR